MCHYVMGSQVPYHQGVDKVLRTTSIYTHIYIYICVCVCVCVCVCESVSECNADKGTITNTNK